MKKIKWIFIIPLTVSALIIMAFAIVDIFSLSFRSIPAEIMSWTVVAGACCIAVGFMILIRNWRRKKNKTSISIISVLINIIIVLLMLAFLYLCMFGFAFGYQPEHVVTKNNKKMVAGVNSFTDVTVYYYEYKNCILRGKEKIGEEWYGSGGYDPFTTSMESKPIRSSFNSQSE